MINNIGQCEEIWKYKFGPLVEQVLNVYKITNT
jgi:hypothetical protein